ncbi:MAG: nucleotidyltransferase family protein [Clostridiales bacterium]|jgi:glucose-1-phosphate thymidylyltransferase|nr:nucleotidyltransferase family protein [Clostridiales bacterium]
MKAIILAAGYATRLYPLTRNFPKGLLKLGGKPILEYILAEIRALPGLDGICVVTNDKFYNHFLEWKEESRAEDVTVLNDHTSNDENKLGAIGDINYVIESLKYDDELFIIAGDNFFTFSLSDYYTFYRSKGSDCVCAKELDDIELLRQVAVAETDNAGKLISLEEKPQNPRSDLAVYAAYFYTKETAKLFKTYINEGNNPDAPGHFPVWLYKRNPVFVYKISGQCYDIGTPTQYEEVGKMVAEMKR